MKISIIDNNENIFETILIPENDNVKNIEHNDGYLKLQLCQDLRKAVNSSPVFSHDSKYLSQYNLCCAVMDRLDTCAEKLNSYGDYPESEEDFMIFMMFSCMLKDAISELFKRLKIEVKKESSKYFNSIYHKSPVYNSYEEEPTDDSFFEYLRSLIFAHPCDTHRAKFLRKNEIQYSPWVIVNNHIRLCDEYEDSVGVRVYTNMSEKILDIHLPFSVLKEYIGSKYNVLPLATKYILEQVSEIENQWKKVKINRNQEPIAILEEVKKVLASRYSDIKDEIEDLIRILRCELSDESNKCSVEKFKSEIISNISAICDATDALDNDRIYEIYYNIILRPKKMHQMANYQLEKIFIYLRDEESEDISVQDKRFGLKQAKYFADEFAKKWVVINADSMSFEEIKLLVRTACYLERQEQENAKVNNI